jgi:hypothetical protein
MRLSSGSRPEEERPIPAAVSRSKVALAIVLAASLVGCSASGKTPAVTPSSGAETALPGATATRPGPTPTVDESTTPGSLAPSDAADLLERAVSHLETAFSFRMAAHEVRAYRVIDAAGAATTVYGEFHTDYAVIRDPTLRVHARYEYRYDPQADFAASESYMYQRDGKYFARFIEGSTITDEEEIHLRGIQPIGGDVYRTLVTNSIDAEFEAETGGTARYTLKHPEWYTLDGAIGFADLGLLHAQENGDELVRQYVSQHYPNVEPMRFTIYVSVSEEVIAGVVVEDDEFMLSVWAEVARASIERGGNPDDLPRYEVLSASGAEYVFSDYDGVEQFQIP